MQKRSRLRFLMLAPAALLSLLAMGLAVAPARAERGSRFELTADGRLVDVQVLVGDNATPLYTAPGRWDRRYFQALRGRNYALAVTNNSGRRIGVLIAVDGLNVVNGQQTSLSSGEAMYVLDPYERTVIRGWRSSLDDVRKFVFVDEERSYAERTGQSNGDLGWIRVLAFNEAGSPWYRIQDKVRGDDGDRVPTESESKDGPQAGRRAPDAAPPVAQAQPEPREKQDSNRTLGREEPQAPEPSSPGTGWGDRRYDPVRRVWFVPAPVATDQLVLRYEYASGLRALGIEPRSSRDRLWERERGELGFAQPPRW